MTDAQLLKRLGNPKGMTIEEMADIRKISRSTMRMRVKRCMTVGAMELAGKRRAAGAGLDGRNVSTPTYRFTERGRAMAEEGSLPL